jgi:predicted transcriptional regulator
MPRVSKPMKLVALRIDEEQKARLEQLAEERDVTLSRAFREGAVLYLNELREKAHKARGGDVTFLGIRRDDEGRTLNKPSTPTAGERKSLDSLAIALDRRGLGDIRSAWEAGTPSPVVFAALGQWLALIGRLYVSNAGEVGWDWFLRDYCPGYERPEASEELRRVIRFSLVSQPKIDVLAVLDSLAVGCARLLHDAETQDVVRRSILPIWAVLQKERKT